MLPFRSLSVAIFTLIFTIHVHGSFHYVPNDIHCSKDLHVSFVHNSYSYNAPLHKFTNITKSFFDIAWYSGAPAPNTTGTDNVPGATRSGVYLGNPFTDTLTMYSIQSDALTYSYHGSTLVWASPNQPPVHVDGYAETMRFESICGGKATYIDIISYLCTDDQTRAYTLQYTVHDVTFGGLAANIGATILAGDCPQDRRKHDA
ncbi:hypothetical protein B0H19DRAFT_1252127 [Mycena capillaripes]|nr:hypothetical protein B0H19DRAFT_1252127 [Mycena capillaripes]